MPARYTTSGGASVPCGVWERRMRSPTTCWFREDRVSAPRTSPISSIVFSDYANVWGVDLPGEGSNVHPDPYGMCTRVLVEAACHFRRPVMVGHFTGGEYILSVPNIAKHAAGIVLMSTAPNAAWMPAFEQMCRTIPCLAITKPSQPTRRTRLWRR
jgi:hypothetical protein